LSYVFQGQPTGTTQTTHWAAEPPTPIKEQTQVPSTNSKAFKIVLTDDSERVIEANEVVEDGGRLKFLGVVDGHSGHSMTGDVVASFLSANVAEYGIVPVPEEVRVGANTYRITFALGGGGTGGTQDVVADKVLITQGTEKGAGQFTLVTSGRHQHDSRTEFVISEANVYSITRVTDSGETPVVSASIPAPIKV
jgi:hypothetical protein